MPLFELLPRPFAKPPCSARTIVTEPWPHSDMPSLYFEAKHLHADSSTELACRGYACQVYAQCEVCGKNTSDIAEWSLVARPDHHLHTQHEYLCTDCYMHTRHRIFDTFWHHRCPAVKYTQSR